MPPLARTPRTFDPATISVLIVDDQSFVRSLIADVLRSVGVLNINVANDGATGLEALGHIRPDAIFTDWVMPNVDGIAFTQSIRKMTDPQLQQVPIILVTGLNQRSQIEFARASGIDEFVLKPVSAKAIGERLRKVIEQPRPFVNCASYVGPCRRRRADPAFLGPYRRFDDPIEIDGDADEIESDGLRAVIQMTSARVKDLLVTQGFNASNVRSIHLAASEMQGIAEDLGDVHLQRVLDQLLSYLVAANRVGRVSGEVIILHMDAIILILRTPKTQRHACDEIVTNLERVLKQPVAGTAA